MEDAKLSKEIINYLYILHLFIVIKILIFVFREYFPTNIMHDKRVVKGSTHAAMIIPAGSYPDALFGNTNKLNKKNGSTMK